MNRSVDLVVIGTGAAGDAVASAGAKAGWDVAIVDERPYGGTCALRGCDPKKVLISAAEAADGVRRMAGKGVSSAGVRINWPELIAFKRTFTEPMSAGKRERFAAAGMTCLDGLARFIRADTLRVGDDEIQARHIVIATGAMPVPLPFAGAEHVIDSEAFMELEALPQRIAFIGGGYIAVEFSGIALAAGAEVTVLERGHNLLRNFDDALCRQLAAYMETRGIRVRPEHEVELVEQSGDAFRVTARTADGPRVFEADLVVHAAGRVAAVEGLDLDVGGVEYSRHGIAVNEYLQSESNPAVYAAGDVAATDGYALTPVASHEGEVVAHNLLHGNSRRPDYDVLPTVVFSHPPFAMVGRTEEQARAQGLSVRVSAGDASSWQTARRLAIPCYGYKFVIEEETERVVGATLLGPHAEDAINTLAVGMRAGLTTGQIDDMLWAYPTTESDFWYMT